jgi:C-terminal processing protease CtpA/Prc
VYNRDLEAALGFGARGIPEGTGWVMRSQGRVLIALALVVGTATNQGYSNSPPMSSRPDAGRTESARALERIRRQLAHQDIAVRRAGLLALSSGRGVLAQADDEILSLLANCVGTHDADAQQALARVVLQRWLSKQRRITDPRLIGILVGLASSGAPEVREIVLDHLPRTKPKTDEVIRALVRLGVDSDDPLNDWGRIASGLHSFQPRRLETFFRPYLDDHEADPCAAGSAYMLFRRVAHENPCDCESAAAAACYYLCFSSRDHRIARDGRAILQLFRTELRSAGVGPRADHRAMVTRDQETGAMAGVALIDAQTREVLTPALRRSKALRFLEVPATTGIRRKFARLPTVMQVTSDGTITDAPRPTYEQTLADLHHVLGKRYPNFRMKGIDWEKVGRELLPRAREVADDRDFGLLCMEMVARLEDTHAVVSDGTAKRPKPPMAQWHPGCGCVQDDRGEPVVYYLAKESPAAEAGMELGMTILFVNGKPAARVLKDHMRSLSKYFGFSSDRHLRYLATQRITHQLRRGAPVHLVARTPSGRASTFRLEATIEGGYLPRLPVPIEGIRDDANMSWKMLKGDVGYIYVRRIRRGLIESLDKAVGELPGARGLIVDVRGNPGGGFDAARSFRNFDVEDTDEPGRPRFAGPMALLIDQRCISAGEGWASWFVARKRAKLFGAATAGASSRKTRYTLLNETYRVTFPIKAYKGFLDRPIERRGLEPDVAIAVNAADLAAGRDTVLEAARDYLMAQAAVPQTDAQSQE